ncbi:MAG: helix-turn-helix domain-containing protein [Bacteroidales bacterium]
MLSKYLSCTRWLYNFGLHTKIESYENSGAHTNKL